ncbi:MAG: hypothetical protein M1828_005041 [Chrysothrix sp. TS-e1954]|nr:MAG: hypothetical protein M1828_005041 [Chrysothrix sp. TS-e1954]
MSHDPTTTAWDHTPDALEAHVKLLDTYRRALPLEKTIVKDASWLPKPLYRGLEAAKKLYIRRYEQTFVDMGRRRLTILGLDEMLDVFDSGYNTNYQEVASVIRAKSILQAFSNNLRAAWGRANLTSESNGEPALRDGRPQDERHEGEIAEEDPTQPQTEDSRPKVLPPKLNRSKVNVVPWKTIGPRTKKWPGPRKPKLPPAPRKPYWNDIPNLWIKSPGGTRRWNEEFIRPEPVARKSTNGNEQKASTLHSETQAQSQHVVDPQAEGKAESETTPGDEAPTIVPSAFETGDGEWTVCFDGTGAAMKVRTEEYRRILRVAFGPR